MYEKHVISIMISKMGRTKEIQSWQCSPIYVPSFFNGLTYWHQHGWKFSGFCWIWGFFKVPLGSGPERGDIFIGRVSKVQKISDSYIPIFTNPDHFHPCTNSPCPFLQKLVISCYVQYIGDQKIKLDLNGKFKMSGANLFSYYCFWPKDSIWVTRNFDLNVFEMMRVDCLLFLYNLFPQCNATLTGPSHFT